MSRAAATAVAVVAYELLELTNHKQAARLLCFVHMQFTICSIMKIYMIVVRDTDTFFVVCS